MSSINRVILIVLALMAGRSDAVSYKLLTYNSSLFSRGGLCFEEDVIPVEALAQAERHSRGNFFYIEKERNLFSLTRGSRIPGPKHYTLNGEGQVIDHEIVVDDKDAEGKITGHHVENCSDKKSILVDVHNVISLKKGILYMYELAKAHIRDIEANSHTESSTRLREVLSTGLAHASERIRRYYLAPVASLEEIEAEITELRREIAELEGGSEAASSTDSGDMRRK